jgi:hypothetical protein
MENGIACVELKKFDLMDRSKHLWGFVAVLSQQLHHLVIPLLMDARTISRTAPVLTLKLEA